MRKFLVVFSSLFVAFLILFISVLRSAEVRYNFNPSIPPANSVERGPSQIEYYLPYPGGVLPDSPLWAVKAVRDRLWYLITTNDGKKAELLLLFADKRLNTAITLFEKGEPELGLTTLTKAEKYLKQAMDKSLENKEEGMDTSEFFYKIAVAALKHYEDIKTIESLAPDDARPVIYGYEDYSKNVYEAARDGLLEMGKIPPENPFKW